MTDATHAAPLPPLAVTGSTGYLGGLVARHLTDAHLPVRLLARDPARAPRLPGAEAVLSSYADDPETRSSLAGVRTLFMVSASESADRLQQHRALIDAAAAAGVERIVYTSFYGAAPDATFTLARDHWTTEQRVGPAPPDDRPVDRTGDGQDRRGPAPPVLRSPRSPPGRSQRHSAHRRTVAMTRLGQAASQVEGP